MANRFQSPFEQYLDALTASFLEGGSLGFFVTTTDTPADTYADSTLTIANVNPVPLDSAGRHSAIFLDPATVYKVVLYDANGGVIATADPVTDPAANISAAFRVHAGNPNGTVAGSAGAVGGSSASVIWDITNDLLYVCTTSGDAASAVWSQVGGSLAGQVTQTGVISPATLTASTDDWGPVGLSTASVIRFQGDADHDVTGIVAQPEGTLLTLINLGLFPQTLKKESAGSAAANRFALSEDILLGFNMAVTLRYDGITDRWRPTTKAETPYPAGYLFGLTTSNNSGDATNDIDIAAGKCRSHDDEENIVLAAALTKRLDAAWAVGTNQGGLDTGSIANGTYHIWLIKRTDTGVVDALFSTSATAPAMPTGYDYKRRIWSFRRIGAAIKAYTQRGDHGEWTTPVIDVNDDDPGTSALTRTLTVPTGIIVEAKIIAAIFAISNSYAFYVSPLTATDSTIQTHSTQSLTGLVLNSAVNVWTGSVMNIFTNISGQIRTRQNASAADNQTGITTIGWIDTRGRLA